MPKFTKETAKQAGAKSKRGISEKTKQWEELGQAISTKHTERFNSLLNKMPDDKFVNLYLQVLEYFKPKQLRTEIKDETVKEIVVKLPDDNKSK